MFLHNFHVSCNSAQSKYFFTRFFTDVIDVIIESQLFSNITRYESYELWTLNFLYFENNSCSRNSANNCSKSEMEGMWRRSGLKIYYNAIYVVLVSLLLTVNVTTSFWCFWCWLWGSNSLMSHKLSICAVIRVDSIASEGNGITHRHRIARSFCLSYFVEYIGCNVPFWYYFSDI